ncbi:MAG: hypothetical protein KDD62_05195 [Bdellovibrionales bacterium]|nr:hypothetical protein [Bdellovibrionales bacterium]
MSQPKVEKYSAVVIDNDMQARMRLKAATASVHNFGEVKLVNNFNECLAYLGDRKHVDVVFLANRFSSEDQKKFIQKAKSLDGGQDSAYVIVMGTDSQDSQAVAQNVLIGADGFLLEPFSVDNLLEITRLAARVKRERSFEREAAAIRILVKDVIKQVDRCWFLKRCDFDPSQGFKKLGQICEMFNEFANNSWDAYITVLCDEFNKAPVASGPEKDYQGVSARVKKRMEAKLLADMQAEAEADERRRQLGVD